MNFFLNTLMIVAAASVAYGAVVPNTKTKVIHPLLTSLALPKTLIHPKPNDDRCDEDQFTDCTQKFAVALGLPSFPDDATQFLYYLMGYALVNGLPGFETECKATNEYVACLGQSFDSCLSVQNLESEGLSDDDANVYATLAQQMRFQCGPAYEIMVEHFDCAMADIKENSYQLVRCVTAYTDAISKDPDNICEETQTFTDCYAKVFDDCGGDFEAALCGSMKAGYSVSLPQCSIACGEDERLKMKSKNTLRSKRGIRLARKH